MAMFEKKKESPLVEEQIRILATNVEVLNQKLMRDPYAAITPGEAVIKKNVQECLKGVHEITSGQTKYHQEMHAELHKQLAGLNQSAHLLTQYLKDLPQQRQELSVQIQKLSAGVSGLENIDHELTKDLVKRIDNFNASAQQLQQTMAGFHQQVTQVLNVRINEIGENVANKLVRTSAYFIVGLIVLSMVLTLVFTKFFLN